MNKRTDFHLTPDGRRRLLLFAVFYVVLWVAAWFAAKVLEGPLGVSLWFLPAGLRFFCLLVFGWFGVVLELVVQLVFVLIRIVPVPGSPKVDFSQLKELWLLAPLVATALVVLPLHYRIRRSWDSASPAHAALFFCAALSASGLSALGGAYGMLRLGYIQTESFAEIVTCWLIGDFVGIVTLAPFLLVRFLPRLWYYFENGRWISAGSPAYEHCGSDFRILLMVVCSLLLALYFPVHMGASAADLPLFALLLLIPLAIISWRCGLQGAVLATMLLDSGLVMLVSRTGLHDQAIHYQVVMTAIALVGLWLSGAVETTRRLMGRYRDFAGVSNDLLWEADCRGCLVEAGGRLAETMAWPLGVPWIPALEERAGARLRELREAVEGLRPFRNLEVVIRGAEADARWLHLNGLPYFNPFGDLLGYRGTAVDVSQTRRAEQLLQEFNERLLKEVGERTRELNASNQELATKERHLQVLLAAVPVGVLEIDDGDCCRYINDNGCSLAGVTQEQAIGLPWLELVHADDRDYVALVWQNNRYSEDIHWLEFRMSHSDLRCTAHWIGLGQAAELLSGAIVVLSNATARSQYDERLWIQAHHDALTDLPNRNLFWDRMAQALRYAKRSKSGVALLWIDLDGFKAINDTLGHAAGDALLQQVAQRLKNQVRDSDTLARMGGDEFALIMADVSALDDVLNTATELAAKLAEAFDLPQGTVCISGSLGAALYPQHADTAEALVRCADMAMYSAKYAGKGQARVWTP